MHENRHATSKTNMRLWSQTQKKLKLNMKRTEITPQKETPAREAGPPKTLKMQSSTHKNCITHLTDDPRHGSARRRSSAVHRQEMALTQWTMRALKGETINNWHANPPTTRVGALTARFWRERLGGPSKATPKSYGSLRPNEVAVTPHSGGLLSTPHRRSLVQVSSSPCNLA